MNPSQTQIRLNGGGGGGTRPAGQQQKRAMCWDGDRGLGLGGRNRNGGEGEEKQGRVHGTKWTVVRIGEKVKMKGHASEWVTDRNAKKKKDSIRMKHESTSYSVLIKLRRSRTSCEFQTSRTLVVVFLFPPLLFRFSFSFLGWFIEKLNMERMVRRWR